MLTAGTTPTTATATVEEGKSLFAPGPRESSKLWRSFLIFNFVLVVVGLAYCTLAPLSMTSAIVFGLLVIYPRKFCQEYVGIVKPTAYDLTAGLAIITAVGLAIVHATAHNGGHCSVAPIAIFYPFTVAYLIVSTVVMARFITAIKKTEPAQIPTATATTAPPQPQPQSQPQVGLPAAPAVAAPQAIPQAYAPGIPVPPQFILVPAATTGLYPTVPARQ